MQFNDIRYDEKGIISFCLEGSEDRKYNPFLVSYQAMTGNAILEDYQTNGGNLIPRYIPVKFLKDADITFEMNTAMKWLLDNCVKEQEKYYWLYDYEVSYGIQKLNPGWKSAYGQAYAALAMILFFAKTGEEIYKEYALGAVRGLTAKIEDGGCVYEIGHDEIWFEEIPEKNATHIFNAHLISMIAIAEIKKYMQVTEFDCILSHAVNALKDKIEWMDTGIMSAYDMPRTIDFQLQLDSENFGNTFYVGEVSLDDGEKTSAINLKESKCFEVGDCYASGVDWSAELNEKGYRKIINGRTVRDNSLDTGTIQNTYLNFTNVSAVNKLLKFTIVYSVNEDIKLILKKNCGSAGFKQIGFTGEIDLCANETKKIIYIPTRSLFPELSLIYHRYHIELLEEILNIQYDTKISKILNNFVKYIHQRKDYVMEPRLESLSVCLNTQCGLFCKMCDLGIKNKEASIYQYLKGKDGELNNQQLDRDIFLERCKESDESLKLIHFVGTEPTLYKDLPILIKDLKEMDKQVLVTTNGINLKNMLIPMIEAGVDKILISLDGPSDLHDEIRGKKGLFTDIMNILQSNEAQIAAARENGFDVVACCAITPMNYLRLDEMVEELSEYGIRDIWCTHMNYVDVQVADTHNLYHPDYHMGASCIHEEMNPRLVNPWLMYQSIKTAKSKAKHLGINFVEAPVVSSVEDYTNLYHRPNRIVGQEICRAPFRTMQINSGGGTCVMSRCYQMEMGNIKDNSLMELFFSSEIVNLRNEILSDEQWEPCKRCCAIM